MIIWLASYPKSGNTYVRSFLASYYFSKNGEFDFNLLKNIDHYPNKKYFDEKIDSPYKASQNWIESQDNLIKNNKKKNFIFKTHSALIAINNNHFTSKKNTLGFIYIIRDPRNVITSIKNHYTMDYEEALKMMLNENEYLFDKSQIKDYSNFVFLSSWKNHYKSWMSNNQYKRIIIKYEDLEKNTFETFEKLIIFINNLTNDKKKIDKEKILNSIKSTNFSILKKKEKEEGFIESVNSKVTGEKLDFFNLGFKNKWQNLLDENLKINLNNTFKDDLILWKYKI